MYSFSDRPDRITLKKIAKASGRLRRQTGKEFLFAIPCKLLSFIVAHTVAVKLIYPGSLSLINLALGMKPLLLILLLYLLLHIFMLFKIVVCCNIEGSTLMKGRVDLITQGGERFKLMTIDKNLIDAIFVDRRNK